MYMYIYICVYIYVYIYMCVYNRQYVIVLYTMLSCFVKLILLSQDLSPRCMALQGQGLSPPVGHASSSVDDHGH